MVPNQRGRKLSCSAGSRFYTNPALIGTRAWKSHLLLERTCSTEPGHCWTEPSPRGEYWRTNRHVAETERDRPTRADQARGGQSTNPHCVGTSWGWTIANAGSG